MIPPHCGICGAAVPDRGIGDFVLLYFQRTPEWAAGAENRAATGWAGHPPNAEWFCSSHKHLGERRTHLLVGDALTQIRTELSES